LAINKNNIRSFNQTPFKQIVLGYLCVFFSFLILYPVFAQKNNKEKLFVSYHENGQLHEKGYLKDIRKNGTWVKYSYSGNLQELINYYEGFQEGYYAEFDSDGKIKREGIYRNGKKTGLEYEFENGKLARKIIWYPATFRPEKDSSTTKRYEEQFDVNERLRQAGYFTGKKKDSTWFYYDDSGRKKAIENYINGKRSGLQERYYINGQIAEHVEFAEGKMNGFRIQLSENGDTLECGKYKDNKKNGYCFEKKLLRLADMGEDLQPFAIKGNYILDKPEGVFEVFYPDGNLAAQENYKEAKLEGKRELFYKNGNLMFRCAYINNKKNGVEEQFYESGLKKSVTPFDSGTINGTQQYFFESGKISEEIFFESGKVKKLIRFFENGKIRNTINY
jgi:uncharacterized protein